MAYGCYSKGIIADLIRYLLKQNQLPFAIDF